MKKRRKRRTRTLSPGRIGAAAFVILLAAAAVVIALLEPASNRLVTLTPEQIDKALEANEYASEEARITAESAVSLVGKVHYFWGGKSYCKGPDPDWGELRTVTSAGSPATGTERPYGLDCSGFITWVFIQANPDENVRERIGEGTWNQWESSSPIEWKDIRVGDLVFQNEYPGSNSNHVGVCIGYLGRKPVFAHCSSEHDNVVVTTAGGVFRYARRPNL